MNSKFKPSLLQRRLSVWVEALGIADSASTMLSGGGLVTFVQEWTGQVDHASQFQTGTFEIMCSERALGDGEMSA